MHNAVKFFKEAVILNEGPLKTILDSTGKRELKIAILFYLFKRASTQVRTL